MLERKIKNAVTLSGVEGTQIGSHAKWQTTSEMLPIVSKTGWRKTKKHVVMSRKRDITQIGNHAIWQPNK